MTARPRALLTALVLAGGSLLVPAPALAAGGSISGTVTDPEGLALAGICVDVVPLDGEGEVLSDATDSAGRFEVGGLPAGDYAVGINVCPEPDSAFAPEWFDDQGGFETATPVTVTGTSAVTGIDTLLARTGSLAGTVTDEDDGRALGGICVRAFGSAGEGFAEAITGDDGSYVVEGLAAGDYVVLLSDCGEPFTHRDELYDDIVLDGTTEPQPTEVAVRAGERTGGIDAALLEGGALQGTVTAAHTGRPQPLVCVGLYPGSSAQATDATVTGIDEQTFEPTAEGSFVLGGVAPGTYALSYNADACGEDDGYDVTWYDGAATREGATPLTVAKGQVEGGLDGLVTPRPSTSFVCAGPDGEAASFSDVPRENVHRSSITCLNAAGIVRGRSDGTYGPAEPVRRDQLASFVARLLETAGVALPSSPPDDFDDDEGSPHERSIDQLAELGLLGGKGPRRFAPGETVERGQLATVLVNAYEEVTGFSLLRPAERPFTDTAGTTHEANIERASLAGIVAGTTATTYDASGRVRRDALATFLARVLDRSARDTLASQLGSGEGEASAPVAASSSQPSPPARLERLRAVVAGR